MERVTDTSLSGLDRLRAALAASPLPGAAPLLHQVDDYIAPRLANLDAPLLAVVGGSGSGKTTLLKMLTGLLKPASGTVEVRGTIQMVFQDPRGSLNPRLRVGRSIKEAGPDVAQALVDVGLHPSDAQKYPHEFSGGQHQRISIARALVGRPDILLADEAVSALDVTVRRQILELLDRLVDEYGLTLVFVTHDLGVVKEMCSSVAVVHEGRIVEHGPVDEIWEHPQHSYTQRLLAAAKLP